MFIEQDIQQGFVPFPESRAKQYQEDGCWKSQTHFQLLVSLKDRFPERVAAIQDHKQLTYQQMYDYAIHYGSYLKQQGIRETDFVLLQSPNVIEVFIIIFGLYAIGARPVFCLHGHGSYEIENIARQSRAAGFIKLCASAHEATATEVCEEFSTPNFKLWFRENIVSQSSIKASLPQLQSIEPDFNLQALSESEDIAFLQLSGGTTGLPKLIPRTHADYIYSIEKSIEVTGLTQDTKQLVVLPVMHNFCMSSPGFLGVFCVGGTVVLSQLTQPRVCFELIQKYQIQQVSLVPAIATLWLNAESLKDYDLSSLQVIQVGGAKLLPSLAEQIIDTLQVKLQQVYGMAEGLVNFTHLDDPDQIIIQTQGKKLSHLDEIRIADQDGNALPVNAIGNIQTRGPYTINGYYNLPDINRRAFTEDGFYKTGDIGYLDENLNIIVTGREKEQINRSGEKITPSEVEEFILQYPSVKDVCVIGVSDKYLGERIKAIIIPKLKNDDINLKDIRKFLIGKNIAHFKIPDEIEVVPDFKYTHVGKVNRQKLG
ncbi:(2,3-dihydroxybenzoyl)adenylate synthase [Acinetobacter soli]|uniref:(2,3-dihydroxybenzoyl)adenylate synthase n=1 Tax=Acinetobacter soli TaxID=487316 RepID=UPI00125F6D7E|nr:AMP-binding protein [Acinetobacter soli]